MKIGFFKIVNVTIVMTILLTFLVAPIQLAYADDDFPNGKCECVTYVVFSLFGKRLEGGGRAWPDAQDLANPNFWSAAHMKENKLSPSLARTRSNTAKRGDVIIFQSDATYYVQTISRLSPYVKQTSAGYGSGHIGIVLYAEYSAWRQGWYITMESANWPEAWGQYVSYDETRGFYDAKTRMYFDCKNVSSKQYIFVPNGDKISFWRLIYSNDNTPFETIQPQWG